MTVPLPCAQHVNCRRFMNFNSFFLLSSYLTVHSSLFSFRFLDSHTQENLFQMSLLLLLALKPVVVTHTLRHKINETFRNSHENGFENTEIHREMDTILVILDSIDNFGSSRLFCAIEYSDSCFSPRLRLA
jgi:hypothetical protein